MLDTYVAVLRREWLRLTRYPLWFVKESVSSVLMVVPLLLMAMPWLLADGGGSSSMEATGFILVGTMVWQLGSRIIYSIGWALRDEMVEGTLEASLMCPAPYPLQFAAKATIEMIGGLIQVTLVWLIGYLFFGFHGGVAILAALGVLILYLVSMSGFFFAIAAAVLFFKNPSIWLNLTNAFLSLIGGLLFPISLLPRVIRPLTYLLPSTYAADFMRYIVLGSPLLFGLQDELIALTSMAIIGPVLGLIVFYRMYHATRASGTLLHY